MIQFLLPSANEVAERWCFHKCVSWILSMGGEVYTPWVDTIPLLADIPLETPLGRHTSTLDTPQADTLIGDDNTLLKLSPSDNQSHFHVLCDPVILISVLCPEDEPSCLVLLMDFWPYHRSDSNQGTDYIAVLFPWFLVSSCRQFSKSKRTNRQWHWFDIIHWFFNKYSPKTFEISTKNKMQCGKYFLYHVFLIFKFLVVH